MDDRSASTTPSNHDRSTSPHAHRRRPSGAGNHPGAHRRERTINITTTGRPHRIEIWFFRAGDQVYLSSSPGRKDRYANLLANPTFRFHLKNDVQADLAARGTLITDEQERRRVFEAFIDDLNQPSNPARLPQPLSVDDWLVGSPSSPSPSRTTISGPRGREDADE